MISSEVLGRLTDPLEVFGSPSASSVADVAAMLEGDVELLCELDIAHFCSEKIEFDLAAHHFDWCNIANDKELRRICILSHRDSGKSYFWSFAVPLHFSSYSHTWAKKYGPAWKNPQFYLFSDTQKQATDHLELVIEEIHSNNNFKHLRPYSGKTRWSKSEIRLKNGVRLRAIGMGVSIRGRHPHYIVIDDGVGEDNLFSEANRERDKEYMRSTIENLSLTKVGRIFLVGTPFHADDVYAEAKKNPVYRFLQYRAIEPDPVTGKERALWPERYSIEDLELKKKTMANPISFSREFMCEPITSEMSLFPYEIIKPCYRDDLILVPSIKPGSALDRETTRYTGADFAISTSVGADWTVFFTVAVDAHGNRFLIDIFRAKGMDFNDQIAQLKNIYARYRPQLMYLESNQMQKIFPMELRRTTALPVKDFVTGVQKNSFEKGVPSLRMLFENRKYQIPRGDEQSVRLTDLWIKELTSFGWERGKLAGVGSHDDIVMASWLCEEACKGTGFSYEFI